MNLNVHSIHFDADAKLVGFIRERLAKLSLFNDRILGGEVYLRLSRDGDHRENKLVEIKLAVPGKELFAKRKGKSFEEATDQSVEALRRQVERLKTVRLKKAS
ncbi:MAG: ribosome-associated translation inhibitor RaiA [Flavobacteriales bacterium]|nr:ribosome-associated translation inhibitor RaiA [Flavobacteriales bacterium]